MMVGDQSLQPLLQNVGINLRRSDVGMAEQLLHHPKIRAILQEMTGEGMPQDVR
jgi:hypothetical protein